MNTASLTEGYPIWLSPTTAGALTTTKPSAPDHLVLVGFCIRQHAVNGIMLVKVVNGFELDELHDVALTTKTNGDLLQYDSSTNCWKNVSSIAPSSVTGTAVITSDARLSNSRTPTAHASTHASAGSDPITISPSQVTGMAVITTDSRLSDARTPTTHATTHVPGGSDAIDITKIVAKGTTLPSTFTLYPAGTLFAFGSAAPYLLYRSTGAAWEQLGSASTTVSDTAPSSPQAGALWYKSSNGKTYIYYADANSSQWVEVGESAQVTIPGHASTHIRGGSDIIDGDRLTVDYVPTNYTRNSAASGAGDVTDLTAHLSGLDLILPAGMLMPYAGTTEPNGWVFCYGQTVDSVANTAYARLFAAIGTTYGGTGASSFVIPDMRGRAIAGKDNMGGTTASRLTSAGSGIAGTTLGSAGGTETHTLSTTQIPSHSHGGTTGNDSPDHSHSTNQTALGETAGMYHRTGNFTFGSGDTGGGGGAGSNLKAVPSGGASARHAHSITAEGGGLAHLNTQPTIILNYLIKT
jgi:microcystin-dependent protein